MHFLWNFITTLSLEAANGFSSIIVIYTTTGINGACRVCYPEAAGWKQPPAWAGGGRGEWKSLHKNRYVQEQPWVCNFKTNKYICIYREEVCHIWKSHEDFLSHHTICLHDTLLPVSCTLHPICHRSQSQQLLDMALIKTDTNPSNKGIVAPKAKLTQLAGMFI